MKTHKLKTWTEYYNLVETGKKSFELRKNDRDYKSGDAVILQDYDPILKKHTGREMSFLIGVMVENVESFGLKEGYCIFQLAQQQVKNNVVSDDVSLRDKLAMHALTGLLSNEAYFSCVEGMIIEHKIFERAYAMADGMLKIKNEG